jgi:hypothetical protein
MDVLASLWRLQSRGNDKNPTPLTSTAALEVKSRKSKVKSQKTKDLYSRLLRHLKWYVYLRRAVLATQILAIEFFFL